MKRIPNAIRIPKLIIQGIQRYNSGASCATQIIHTRREKDVVWEFKKSDRARGMKFALAKNGDDVACCPAKC